MIRQPTQMHQRGCVDVSAGESEDGQFRQPPQMYWPGVGYVIRARESSERFVSATQIRHFRIGDLRSVEGNG